MPSEPEQKTFVFCSEQGWSEHVLAIPLNFSSIKKGGCSCIYKSSLEAECVC